MRKAIVLGLLAVAVAFAATARGSEAAAEGAGGDIRWTGPSLFMFETRYYSYTKLASPERDTFEEKLEAQRTVYTLELGFPMLFQDDKVAMFNKVGFQQTSIGYKNWDYGVVPKEQQPADFYALTWEYTLWNQLSEHAGLYTVLMWGSFPT